MLDIIGIDLGTTNSVATVYTKEGLKHISFDNNYLLPSVVNISENGVLVGVQAKNMAMIAADNTAISIKRLMGSDEKVTLNNKKYSPEEISSLIIKKIVQTANEEMGKEYKRCVVTVPAYFNEKQREATSQAVKLAGIEPIRIINEPTAAAISYGADKDEDMLYAIYDLGGGTFDISIIENSQGLIEVIATSGDNHLGGDDFDKKLADFILEKSNLKLKMTKGLEIKLFQLAQNVKIELSSKEEVSIDEKFFAKVDGKSLHLEVTISKEEFENLIQAEIDRTISLLQEAIADSGYDLDELHSIILTGGSSKIPFVTEEILAQTGKLPLLIEDPDKSVSIGAIMQGAMIEGIDTNSILIDITPYSLGTSSLNQNDQLILTKIILKNTTVPTIKTSRFYATVPYQKAYQIAIYQGENEDDLEKDFKIGEMMLEMQNPVEEGQVDITFALDQNGILKVTGIEVTTGEKVEGEFKTVISKSSNHKKIANMGILSQHEESILLKIDNLLENKEILDEDKKDLKALKAKYLNAQSEEKKSIEEEIIDTIFFLEE